MADILPDIEDDEFFIRVLLNDFDVRKGKDNVRPRTFKPIDGKVSVIREKVHNLKACCSIAQEWASKRNTNVWGFAKIKVTDLYAIGITNIEHEPTTVCPGHYNLVYGDVLMAGITANPEDTALYKSILAKCELKKIEDVLNS